MKLSKISLLSRIERAAFQIDFAQQATILVGGNGFGKSAVVKSIYEALGAKPLKVDKSWRDAQVTTMLEFSVGENSYTALKVGGRYTIFSQGLNIIVSTTNVMSGLAPVISSIFDFHLILADKQDQIRNPSPSYCFAPFYIDQDGGWIKTWNSFQDLSIFPNSPKTLAEYHSGLKPNAYYEAKADRDRLRVELLKTEAERNVLKQALSSIQENMPQVALFVNINDFQDETTQLTNEAQRLHDIEVDFRRRISVIREEEQVWHEQVHMLTASIREADLTFASALTEAGDVECPVCGQHYNNNISDQFGLKADVDDLISALSVAQTHLADAHARLANARQKVEEVVQQIVKINQIMQLRKQDISLSDVIKAEGQLEAKRVFNSRILEVENSIEQLQINIESFEKRMESFNSRRRRQDIMLRFNAAMKNMAEKLDVRESQIRAGSIQGNNVGRGSEGPRALAAYYYAFLHTAQQFGSSNFCPIIIDAPNQQGQDRVHMANMLKLFVDEIPPFAQVVIAIENIDQPTSAEVIDISHAKNKVLKPELFDDVNERISPYLRASILRQEG